MDFFTLPEAVPVRIETGSSKCQKSNPHNHTLTRKNPEQKILFFRGEILILVFEVGQFLENLQNFRILYRVSIGNGKPYVKSGKIVDFPKISQLQKLKSRFLHEKIIFFALDFS